MRSELLDISNFPGNLRDRRECLHITQAQLADMVGVTVRVINGWEKNDLKEGGGPKAANIVALCKALDCSFDYLFGPGDFPSAEHEAFFDSCGLSALAYDKLKKVKRAADAGEDHWAGQIAKQHLEVYSAFITDLNIDGALQLLAGRYLRIKEGNLTKDERSVFDDKSEALHFVEYQFTKTMADFFKKYFKHTEIIELGREENGID